MTVPWNPRALLDISPGSCTQCVGTTLKGLRCKCVVNGKDLGEASRLIDVLGGRNLDSAYYHDRLPADLQRLANLMLCKRFHRGSQARSVSLDWYLIIDEFYIRENRRRRAVPVGRAARTAAPTNTLQAVIENATPVPVTDAIRSRPANLTRRPARESPFTGDNTQRRTRDDPERPPTHPQSPREEARDENNLTTLTTSIAQLTAILATIPPDSPAAIGLTSAIAALAASIAVPSQVPPRRVTTVEPTLPVYTRERTPTPVNPPPPQVATAAQISAQGDPSARVDPPIRVNRRTRVNRNTPTHEHVPTPPHSPTPINRVPPHNSSTPVRRRSLPVECYICTDEITDAADAVWCRGQCGQNVHTACFDAWRDAQVALDRNVTCAFCRSPWVSV